MRQSWRRLPGIGNSMGTMLLNLLYNVAGSREPPLCCCLKKSCLPERVPPERAHSSTSPSSVAAWRPEPGDFGQRRDGGRRPPPSSGSPEGIHRPRCDAGGAETVTPTRADVSTPPAVTPRHFLPEARPAARPVRRAVIRDDRTNGAFGPEASPSDMPSPPLNHPAKKLPIVHTEWRRQ